MATRRKASPPPPPPPPSGDPGSSVPPVPPVADDVPPAPSGTRARSGAGTSTGRAPRKAPLQAKLEEFFAAPALLYSFSGDEYAANILAARTPAMAEAWYELSKVNPGVRRILERITTGGAWGGVVLSSAGVILPLLQHHGIVPGSDPFITIMGPIPGASQRRGPIVPPPPSPRQSTPPSGPVDGAAAAGDYAPPVGDAPPGVVTVAGLRSIGADAAVEVEA